MKKLLIVNLATLIAIGLMGAACSNRDYATVGGAALGGVAGNALTGGSTAGTVVGAVGGGFIGNQMAR